MSSVSSRPGDRPFNILPTNVGYGFLFVHHKECYGAAKIGPSSLALDWQAQVQQQTQLTSKTVQSTRHMKELKCVFKCSWLLHFNNRLNFMVRVKLHMFFLILSNSDRFKVCFSQQDRRKCVICFRLSSVSRSSGPISSTGLPNEWLSLDTLTSS